MNTEKYVPPAKSILEKIFEKIENLFEKMGFKFGAVSKKTVKIILAILAVIFIGWIFVLLALTKGFTEGFKFKNILKKGS